MIKEFKDDYRFLSNFHDADGGGFITGNTFWASNEHFSRRRRQPTKNIEKLSEMQQLLALLRK